MRRMLALLLIVALVLCMATVVFADETKVSSPSSSTAADPDKPKDDESPKTGDFILLLAPLMLVGLFGVVVSTKKLVKNH